LVVAAPEIVCIRRQLSATPLPRRAQQKGACVLPTVLIVDDDQAIRETLRLVLEDAGYGVLEAGDGVAALEMLRDSEQSFVVLLDLIMSGVSGEDILHEVVIDPFLNGKHSYVLMTAAHKRLGSLLQRHMSMLAVPVLQKPFDLEQLLEVVATAATKVIAV
jgi:CheY-like chemotaxis protein